jgi:hypothetical protein
MNDYPSTIRCNKTSKLRGSDIPCPGIAHQHKKPLFDVDFHPEKGPWYGCSVCSCLAQYQDFVDHVIQPARTNAAERIKWIERTSDSE